MCVCVWVRVCLQWDKGKRGQMVFILLVNLHISLSLSLALALVRTHTHTHTHTQTNTNKQFTWLALHKDSLLACREKTESKNKMIMTFIIKRKIKHDHSFHTGIFKYCYYCSYFIILNKPLTISIKLWRLNLFCAAKKSEHQLFPLWVQVVQRKATKLHAYINQVILSTYNENKI